MNNQIAEYFSENPKHTQSLYDRTLRSFQSSNVNDCDAEDAVQDAYLALLEKPGHAESFEREAAVSARRMAKLTGHALRDILSKRSVDGLGRAQGALTRREMFVLECQANGIEVPEGREVNQGIYRSSEAPGEVVHLTPEEEDSHHGEIDFMDQAPSPEEIAEARLMVEEAYRALDDEYANDPARLRIAHRSLDLQLQGFGRNAIAEIEGVSPNTQKNRLTEFRKVIRKRWEDGRDKTIQAGPAGGYLSKVGKRTLDKTPESETYVNVSESPLRRSVG